jgi:L-seryl-tRNA(Ser) seleniumtransferase
VAGWAPPGALALDEVAAIAHRHGVPVIVDAAQLPPRENLWRLTQMGADLVIFSGGKDLRGPQSSGLIVGQRDLIAACVLIGAPHHGVARPLKAGKEEIVGLLAAVQLYMEHDEEERLRWGERFVATLVERLAGPGACVERSFPNEAGQPFPRALLRFTGANAVARRARVVDLLCSGQPAVEVGQAGDDGIFINPVTVDRYEEDALITRLCDAVEQSKIGEE